MSDIHPPTYTYTHTHNTLTHKHARAHTHMRAHTNTIVHEHHCTCTLRPRGIAHHGDTETLLRKKKFFRKEVEENSLGSPPNEHLLQTIRQACVYTSVCTGVWVGVGGGVGVGVTSRQSIGCACSVSIYPALPSSLPLSFFFLSLHTALCRACDHRCFYDC